MAIAELTFCLSLGRSALNVSFEALHNLALRMLSLSNILYMSDQAIYTFLEEMNI